MKTIYLVRHGEAANNVNPANYVGPEGKLTELGRKQAARIAERAQRLPLEAVIASSYVRAQETARLISDAVGIQIETSELFVERKEPTSLFGTVWANPEVQRTHTEWLKTFFTKGARVQDGENFEDMFARTKESFAFLENHTASSILLVTHGFYLRMLVGYTIFGEELTPELFKKLEWGLRTKNTGVTVLHFDPNDQHGKWWVSVWNDHAHLAEA